MYLVTVALVSYRIFAPSHYVDKNGQIYFIYDDREFQKVEKISKMRVKS